MLLSPLPVVKGLGREHVAIVLAYEKGLIHVGGNVLFVPCSRVVSRMSKIIICVYVFKQIAFFQIPDSAGSPAIIHLMGYPVGYGIKLIVIKALVDPDSPEDDAGMVPVFPYHLPDVLCSLCLPALISQMLPSGDLREYQEPHSVAGLYEIMALRIM